MGDKRHACLRLWDCMKFYTPKILGRREYAEEKRLHFTKSIVDVFMLHVYRERVEIVDRQLIIQ